MSAKQEQSHHELEQAASTPTQPRKLGKAPMQPDEELKHKESRKDIVDEQMEDAETEQTSGKLSDVSYSPPPPLF